MTVEITGVTISAEKVTIDGFNLDNIIFADDLFEEDEHTYPVVFEFNRKKNYGSEMKYLYKVVNSNKKCREQGNSLGEMITLLMGQIITLSGNFILSPEDEKKSKKK